MAEITVRRRGELVRGVFQLLYGSPDGLPSKEVLARLRALVPPTLFEGSEYPNRPGGRRYEKIVRFATVKATKAGWLVKERGRWSLSDAGREAFARYQDPEEFERKAGELCQQWKGFRGLEPEGETPADAATAAATLDRSSAGTSRQEPHPVWETGESP